MSTNSLVQLAKNVKLFKSNAIIRVWTSGPFTYECKFI